MNVMRSCESDLYLDQEQEAETVKPNENQNDVSEFDSINDIFDTDRRMFKMTNTFSLQTPEKFRNVKAMPKKFLNNTA